MSTSTIPQDRLEFYEDIICAAVEGGINDWAQVSHYQYEMNGEIHRCVGPVLSGYKTRALIHKIFDDESGYEEEGLEVTPEKIQLGLWRLFTDGLGVHEDYIDTFREAFNELEAGMIDAYDASIIVQAGCLGEVVYG